MDGRQALARIQGYAGAFRIRYTAHAYEQMTARHATEDDVREALLTATACRAEEGEKWRVSGGRDLDGDELTIVVAIRGGVVVVTVF